MYVDYVIWNANFNSSFLGIYLKVFPFWFKILQPYQSEKKSDRQCRILAGGKGIKSMTEHSKKIIRNFRFRLGRGKVLRDSIWLWHIDLVVYIS